MRIRSLLAVALIAPTEAAAAPLAWLGHLLQGDSAVVAVTNVAPGERVHLLGSSAGSGQGPCRPFGCAGLVDATWLGSALADAQGLAQMSVIVPANLRGTVWVQAWSASGGFSAVVDGTIMDLSGADDDSDRLPAAREVQLGLDPASPDSDGDGLPDGDDPWPLQPGPPAGPAGNEVIAGIGFADFEIDPLSTRLAWQTAAGEALWLAELDPATGFVVPFDGRGTLLHDQLTDAIETRNGPEWALTAAGSEVVYGREVGGVRSLWRAFEHPTDGWRVEQLPGSEGAFFPYPTQLPGDPDPWVRFSWRDGGEIRTGVRRYLDPASILLLDRELAWSRWYAPDDALVTVSPRAGVPEIEAWSPATRTSTWLTDAPSWKHIPRTLSAPEWSGELALVTLEGPTVNVLTEVVVYRDGGAGLVPVRRLPGTPALPYPFAPEVFVWQGRSYVLYELREAPHALRPGARSQIWVAALEPGGAWHRVCDASPATRRDPEAFVNGQEPWVLYTTRARGTNEVVRCSLGI